jgi:hypothetical protein
MKTAKIVLGSLSFSLLAAVWLAAQDAASVPYDLKIDIVYGEAHGTGLLMDVFTPNEKANGLGIIDVVSGAYHSDRGPEANGSPTLNNPIVQSTRGILG